MYQDSGSLGMNKDPVIFPLDLPVIKSPKMFQYELSIFKMSFIHLEMV